MLSAAASAQFTAEQAAAGRQAYQASCAPCHLPSLAGQGEAPQLAGPGFIKVWGTRSTRDLIAYLQKTMPPGNPAGGLSETAYANIVAYILQANGAAAGGLLALSAGRAAASLLFRVTPYDPAALAGAVAAMVIVAVLASYVPARRATRIEPFDALRME